jgi:hypothetical protein
MNTDQTVETRTLRYIQQLPKASQLLRNLVHSVAVLPHNVYEVFDPPLTMQYIVSLASSAARETMCCADDEGHHWLFIAKMSLSRSRKHRCPVLRLDEFGPDGQHVIGGWWEMPEYGKWRLLAD